nr:MAG TPA_asm: hypothetical protein [Caudoviricetes sp.]
MHKNELVREDKLFCFLYGYGLYNFFLFLHLTCLPSLLHQI